MITDYNDFIQEAKTHYRTILESTTSIGFEVMRRLELSPEDKILIIAHDTLKRLVGNIRVLYGMNINDDTCVAYRLILRATTADLIECLYLLAVSEEERDKEIWKRNLECVRTLKIYFTEKKDFFEKLYPNSLSDKNLSNLYDKYPEYYDSEKNDFYPKKGENQKTNTCGMIKNLIAKKICTSKFQQLTTNYRLLSLTEHYSIVGRKYSYSIPFDYYLTIDVIRWIKLITDSIVSTITEYLDTGKIVVEKVDSK